MRREVQAILLVLLGSAVLRISLFSDSYLRYVRAGLRPYLVAAGVVLVVSGALGAVAALRGDGREGHEGHGHGHDHSRGPVIAWLLLLPVTAILLVAPPALGSYTAQHAGNTVAKPDTTTGFPPLPAGDPLVMRLAEFDVRAAWDTTQPLKGRRVKLLGFASPKAGGGWYVTRLVISCCAADALTYKVEIRGAAAPATGSWVEVTGIWQPDAQPAPSDAQSDPVPALNASQVVPVPEPHDPYE